MDWGEMLNNVAMENVQAYLTPATPSAPVAIPLGGGVPYKEGQPAASGTKAAKTIMGMPAMVVYGGAAVALIGLFLMMRK